MLIDLRPKKATGKAVANALDLARITCNKNMIPFDPEKPFVTSGIRVGTPAVTTRGLKEPEMVGRRLHRTRRGLREDEAALRASATKSRNSWRRSRCPVLIPEKTQND